MPLMADFQGPPHAAAQLARKHPAHRVNLSLVQIIEERRGSPPHRLLVWGRHSERVSGYRRRSLGSVADLSSLCDIEANEQQRAKEED